MHPLQLTATSLKTRAHPRQREPHIVPHLLRAPLDPGLHDRKRPKIADKEKTDQSAEAEEGSLGCPPRQILHNPVDRAVALRFQLVILLTPSFTYLLYDVISK